MEDVKGLLELAKRTKCDRVTADQLLSSGPCYLLSVIISSDGGGDADGVLYDGESTGEERKVDLYALDETQDQLTFDPPIYMRRGLYVDIGSNVQSIVVQYITTKS